MGYKQAVEEGDFRRKIAFVRWNFLYRNFWRNETDNIAIIAGLELRKISIVTIVADNLLFREEREIISMKNGHFAKKSVHRYKFEKNLEKYHRVIGCA